MASSELLKIDQRFRPATFGNEKTLPVPDAMVNLFPSGGIQCGWTVGFSGTGARSLAMVMAAQALDKKDWLACVDSEDLGYMCGHELGLSLDRVLSITVTQTNLWPKTVAALLEAMRIVFVNLTRPVSIGDARRLTLRTKKSQSLLFHINGTQFWPQQTDFGLKAETKQWHGLQTGSGVLKSRRLTVEAYGRRAWNHAEVAEFDLPEMGRKL